MITQRTRIYETLIRYHADGSTGAQQTSIEETLDGRLVIASRLLPPVALTAGHIAEFPKLHEAVDIPVAPWYKRVIGL